MLPEPMTATLSGMACVCLEKRVVLDETDRNGAEDSEIRAGDVAASDRYHRAEGAGIITSPA